MLGFIAEAAGADHRGSLDGKVRCTERTTRKGEANGALTFKKKGGRVVVAHTKDLSGLSELTVTLWVKSGGIGTLVQHGGWCPDGAARFKGMAFSLSLDASGHLALTVVGGSGNFTDPINRITSKGVLPPDRDWHRVRATMGAEELARYIDGERDAAQTVHLDNGSSGGNAVEASLVPRMAASTDVLQIGSGYDYCGGIYKPYSSPFVGSLDDVMMYNAAGPPATQLVPPPRKAPLLRVRSPGPAPRSVAATGPGTR